MDPTSWLVTNFLVPSIFGGIASLFGKKKGLEEDFMTPEERAKYEAERRLSLAASGLEGGGEGAYEAIVDALQTENVSEEEIADILGIYGYTTNLAGTPGGRTDPTLVEMTQETINKAASAVGKAQDTLFDIFKIPKPDYAVIQPNAPGATVIWGEPSGGVFGRIGTTPGGTVTGVQTGIPALDVVLGKVADVVSGRVAAGEVLNTETIEDIIIQTAGEKLGIPGDPSKILDEVKEIGSKVFLDEDTGKLGIDLGGGATTDVVRDVVSDAVDAATSEATLNDLPTLSTSGDRATVLDTPTLSTSGDRATINDLPTLSTSGDRATINDLPTLSTSGDRATVLDIPTLSTSGGDRTLTIPDFDPTETERVPTTDSPTIPTDEVPIPADEAPGGGGVGLGETGVTPTGGVRGVSTEKAGVADIAILYDPSLSLAENMALMLGKKKNKQADAVDSVLMYGGGIVQPTDLNDEIRRIIEGR